MRRLPTAGRLRLRLAMILALIACALAGAARADGHDRAREALQRGEILKLTEILDAAAAQQPGDIMEVELERDDGRWIYELKVLTPEGFLMEMEIDAATGALLELERDDDEYDEYESYDDD
jgi:uncharacterized membrane protein YkoI